MMKVRKVKSYTVGEFDVEMVYNSLLHYQDSLEKFKSWMDREPGRTDAANAIKNMEEEIEEYRKLSMDIYMKCFNTHVQGPADRPEGKYENT